MNDENDDMVTNVQDPLILEIYLYTNNYKDRLLISELKEKVHTVRIPGVEDSSFFVRVDDMYDILHTKFKKDLSDFDSTPFDSLTQTATSIFFIDNMISSFSKMKYFRINISDSPIYTRKKNDSINFDYRIMHTKIDLPTICAPEFLEESKRILTKIGFVSKDPFDKKPYFETSAREVVSRLRGYASTLDPEGEEHQYVTNLQFIFGNKLEKDNSIVLVIIDL
jgi:hypothetical protein